MGEGPRSPIHPRHSSVGRKYYFRPKDMSSVEFTPEQREALERMAIDIFTDMTNANFSFRDALAAILLSGMDWGRSIEKETGGNYGKPTPQNQGLSRTESGRN